MTLFPESDPSFASRHIGPTLKEQAEMLGSLGCDSIAQLTSEVVPGTLPEEPKLPLPPALNEKQALTRLASIFSANEVSNSFIGRGYYGTITPPVIQRNILENPGWYTAYTPYQAEISQGRLEALLNFQTLICDLTGMSVANASLLDEGTAAAEAMALSVASKPKGKIFFVSRDCFSQTIEILKTRAGPIGVELVIGDAEEFDFEAAGSKLIGLLLQYPGNEGEVKDYSSVVERCHAAKGQVIVAADLLSLCLLKPPGEWGADVVVGSAQRFGVPLGFGGPHAAYMACSNQLKRRLPGRLVGISVDSSGKPGLRLSLQTREQHIRREKATSNICTAQVLLAVIAGFYAAYHGREGLIRIAKKIAAVTAVFADAAKSGGFDVVGEVRFDTVVVKVDEETRNGLIANSRQSGVNLREDLPGRLGISFDEALVESGSWSLAFDLFGFKTPSSPAEVNYSDAVRRQGEFLNQPVFNRFHTETEMMRYISRLEEKDIALNRSMIPLGSCTMKLNAAAEMMPMSWEAVGGMHPFAPPEQVGGYRAMIEELERWLADITGFHSVSVQPNAGSQGEYAGLLAIRRYHEARSGGGRDICLIPMSAHGTNPASAVMAGFEVVPVACDEDGNIDLADVKQKAEEHGEELGALMITYPSTHGVFEESIVTICDVIHRNGGQVYMDGANLNAQVGLCSPGRIGADVCHLNLHKTFCIPHGGGGPGVGPIGVGEHLSPYLPGHLDWPEKPSHAVSAAPFGSASILTISWMYIAMMGQRLKDATEVAILNANYMAGRLDGFFPVLYKGATGRVAHECIIDLRAFKEKAGIDVEDVAKRLIDFGFHAPTMSWPVPGTLMIEPTESESKSELDRFCDAMIQIHAEITAVANGEADADDNVLKNAPHTAVTLLANEWEHAYSREDAAYPLDWVRESKYWPPVGRIDNVYGDRNLVCTCEGMEAYQTGAGSAD